VVLWLLQVLRAYECQQRALAGASTALAHESRVTPLLAALMQLLEEVKALPVAWLDALPLKEPLSRMQPQHGDIIVVQEELSPVRTLRAAQLHCH
jgi:hypothetical protein